ncbi:PEP-CTERM sorting domain-containing protein [Microseira sp. BLCC-F43]|uniref:PEP-CTERM sorting domain-containing protein n=1 Tax=Microseira sp. BLCC-F43 TaxID=3153602 RepID=UPI0035BA1D75
MAISTVMKKLLMATAGGVFIALGVTAKAEAFALNGQSLDLPESREANISLARFAATPESELLTIAQTPGMQSNIAFGGPWYEFSFGQVGEDARGCNPADPNGPVCTPSSAGNSVFAGASPWEFEVGAAGAILKVTDAFSRGDAFSIFNFNTLIGATSTPSRGGYCGDNPDICFADPLVSKGAFNLAAGQYSLRIVPTNSPFKAGAAYFRLDEVEVKQVPEPVSVLGLLAFGAMGVANRLKRKPQRHQ